MTQTENSLEDFDSYYNAASGSALVALLSGSDLNQLMANAASSQVQQLVQKFGEDPDFAAFLEGRTAVVMPEQGSAQYDALVQQTGLETLDDFDYEAHIRALTEAERALQTSRLNKKFSSENIKIFHKGSDNTHIDKTSPVVILGSDEDEEIIGGESNDVFLPGLGNDVIDGGSGVDHVIVSARKESIRITHNKETGEREIEFTSDTGNSGRVTAKNIERVNLEDSNLALDLSVEENAGKAALFIGALAPTALEDAEKFGTVLEFVDGDYGDLEALSQLAIDVGLITDLAGSDQDEDLARLVGTNILGEEQAEVTALLTGFMDGTYANLSQAQFLGAVAQIENNIEHVDLVGLAQTGVEYTPIL